MSTEGKTPDEIVDDEALMEPEAMDNDMDLSDMYGSNADLEKGGIPVTIGKATFGVARAGGSNMRYTRIIASKTRPYRRLMQKIDRDPSKLDDKAMNLMRRLQMETFSEACVMWWRHKDLGKNKLYDKHGEVLTHSPDNVLKLFNQMPALFDRLSEEANDQFNYMDVEDDAKN